MKFASLKYNVSNNLGDQVQTLATEQFFPRVDKKFDRDNLHNISEKEKICSYHEWLVLQLPN
jgi:hypothetical protein